MVLFLLFASMRRVKAQLEHRELEVLIGTFSDYAC